MVSQAQGFASSKINKILKYQGNQRLGSYYQKYMLKVNE